MVQLNPSSLLKISIFQFLVIFGTLSHSPDPTTQPNPNHNSNHAHRLKMPFRSSSIQSRIMESDTDRSISSTRHFLTLDISFLNPPSPFHSSFPSPTLVPTFNPSLPPSASLNSIHFLSFHYPSYPHHTASSFGVLNADIA